MSSIDIVIPCYRYGHYLTECVESILSQGIADRRVLIIDDESPDETPAVARALVAKDSRVHYRRHAENCGHIATYNEGIDWCESDYMLLLSADDYLLPGALERAMTLLDANQGVGLCFGEGVELDAQGVKRHMSVPADFRGQTSTVLRGADFIGLCAAAGAGNIVPTPTAVVRTALLKKVGGYLPDLPHSGDLELWLRLAAHGSVGILKSEQAVYRRHSGNMSTAYYEDNRMSDLKQRQAALDVFLATCEKALPEAPRLHSRLLQGLSLDAIKHANSAFNDNRKTQSENLRRLATEIYPNVRKSLQWKVLSCKRILGTQITNALRPLVAKLR